MWEAVSIAGSFGYQFIFFSAVFYLFLAFILISGGSAWLAASVTSNNTFSAGTYNYSQISSANTSSWDMVGYIFQNPFSSIGYLAWLSVAILIVDIYIIVTSVIP